MGHTCFFRMFILESCFSLKHEAKMKLVSYITVKITYGPFMMVEKCFHTQ